MLERRLGTRLSWLHLSHILMSNVLRRCTPHQFSKRNNQLYLYVLTSSSSNSTFYPKSMVSKGVFVGNGRHSIEHQSKIESKSQSTVQSMSPVQSPESRFYTYPSKGLVHQIAIAQKGSTIYIYIHDASTLKIVRGQSDCSSVVT